MTKVKVCGVRRVVDALEAVELGANLVGCVVGTPSPRRASKDEARAIVQAVGPECTVLVTRSGGVVELICTARELGVVRAQVHGVSAWEVEALDTAGLIRHPVGGMNEQSSELPSLSPEPSVTCPGVLDFSHGGSGKRFDWSLLAPKAPRYTYVAGGITPQNVPELLRFDPFGIDVSSGVESAPGRKDHELLRQLFAGVGAAQ